MKRVGLRLAYAVLRGGLADPRWHFQVESVFGPSVRTVQASARPAAGSGRLPLKIPRQPTTEGSCPRDHVYLDVVTYRRSLSHRLPHSPLNRTARFGPMSALGENTRVKTHCSSGSCPLNEQRPGHAQRHRKPVRYHPGSARVYSAPSSGAALPDPWHYAATRRRAASRAAKRDRPDR